jgi:hypothetical protein
MQTVPQKMQAPPMITMIGYAPGSESQISLKVFSCGSGPGVGANSRENGRLAACWTGFLWAQE